MITNKIGRGHVINSDNIAKIKNYYFHSFIFIIRRVGIIKVYNGRSAYDIGWNIWTIGKYFRTDHSHQTSNATFTNQSNSDR